MAWNILEITDQLIIKDRKDLVSLHLTMKNGVTLEGPCFAPQGGFVRVKTAEGVAVIVVDEIAIVRPIFKEEANGASTNS